MELAIVSSNIQHLPPHPPEVACERMLDARDALVNALEYRGPHWHQINFGQEIYRDRPNYISQWTNVFPHTTGIHHEVPISFSTALFNSFQSGLSYKATTGVRHVSPDRYYTIARFIIDGTPVAAINCHPNNKPRPGVDHSPWRIRTWKRYMHIVTEQIDGLIAQGYVVIVGGDLNARRSRIPEFHPHQHTINESGLDHLYAIPPHGITVTVARKRTIPKNSHMDHPIIGGVIRITKNTITKD